VLKQIIDKLDEIGRKNNTTEWLSDLRLMLLAGLPSEQAMEQKIEQYNGERMFDVDVLQKQVNELKAMEERVSEIERTLQRWQDKIDSKVLDGDGVPKHNIENVEKRLAALEYITSGAVEEMETKPDDLPECRIAEKEAKELEDRNFVRVNNPKDLPECNEHKHVWEAKKALADGTSVAQCYCGCIKHNYTTRNKPEFISIRRDVAKMWVAYCDANPEIFDEAQDKDMFDECTRVLNEGTTK